MNKKIIRKIIIKKRKNIKENKLINFSYLINKKIIQKFNLINKKIGLYFSINNEIILDNFFKLKNNKMFFPKIKNNKMDFCQINFNLFKNKNNSKKIKNNFLELKKNTELIFQNKIIQPKLKKNILIPEIIIIPLIAFNENCFRIGYGGGYYDKYLKNKKIIKIGVAFEFQKQMFHVEHHDVQLDYIFTEKRTYKKICKNISQNL